MTGPRQLPLDLPHDPDYAADAFIPGAENAAARAFIESWPDWPGGVLALCGPAGAGKTHLARIWARRHGARLLGWGACHPDLATGPVVLDGPDFPAEPEMLFHLLNAARSAGHGLLLVAEAPPARWGVALPDLASRLAALPVAELAPPGDALLAQLLLKLFADRQITPPAGLIPFLLPRIERSFAAARKIVAALDHAALAAGRAVSIPLARQVLAGGAADGG